MTFNEKEYQHQYYLKHKSKWKGGYTADSQKLVEHHIKYKEIHGVDETIWLTHSEHKQLHIRLKKEQGVTVPKRIVLNAKSRSGTKRPHHMRYVNSTQGKETAKSYRLKNMHSFLFTYGYEGGLRLMECLYVNTKTETISFSSAFYSNRSKIYRIQEVTDEPIVTSIPDFR